MGKSPRKPRNTTVNQVVAIYEVVLKSDAVPVDPFTVSLSWAENEAPRNWRSDPKVLDEAFRRAVKIERRDHPDAEFKNGGVTFTRERLIPASKAR